MLSIEQANSAQDIPRSKAAEEDVMMPGNIVKEGWLEKKGKNRRNWKTRFFKVRSSPLVYHVRTSNVKIFVIAALQVLELLRESPRRRPARQDQVAVEHTSRPLELQALLYRYHYPGARVPRCGAL